MRSGPQLFRVNRDSRESDRVEEVEFSRLGLRERRDIQEWVAANPGILGEDLLIIGKEFSGFDLTNERPDLVAVDSNGKLVVIELKRDDSGADAHWQAIKYASYFRRAESTDIIRIMAEYAGVSQEDAEYQLMQHLGADDLNALNNDQRIILASHRFAPEVTTAALWLNDKATGENLITCVTLTPFQDTDTGSLYIQANIIIPVPVIEKYVVGIGDNRQVSSVSGTSLGEKLQATITPHSNDQITAFLRQVDELAVIALADEIMPDRKSRWAGKYYESRYYHFWYTRAPWSNWGMSYRVNLWPQDDGSSYSANVEFIHNRKDLDKNLAGVSLHPEQKTDPNGIKVDLGSDTLNDDFANKIAGMLRQFIEQITPIVDDPENEADEVEA